MGFHKDYYSYRPNDDTPAKTAQEEYEGRQAAHAETIAIIQWSRGRDRSIHCFLMEPIDPEQENLKSIVTKLSSLKAGDGDREDAAISLKKLARECGLECVKLAENEEWAELEEFARNRFIDLKKQQIKADFSHHPNLVEAYDRHLAKSDMGEIKGVVSDQIELINEISKVVSIELEELRGESSVAEACHREIIDGNFKREREAINTRFERRKAQKIIEINKAMEAEATPVSWFLSGIEAAEIENMTGRKQGEGLGYFIDYGGEKRYLPGDRAVIGIHFEGGRKKNDSTKITSSGVEKLLSFEGLSENIYGYDSRDLFAVAHDPSWHLSWVKYHNKKPDSYYFANHEGITCFDNRGTLLEQKRWDGSDFTSDDHAKLAEKTHKFNEPTGDEELDEMISVLEIDREKAERIKRFIADALAVVSGGELVTIIDEENQAGYGRGMRKSNLESKLPGVDISGLEWKAGYDISLISEWFAHAPVGQTQGQPESSREGSSEELLSDDEIAGNIKRLDIVTGRIALCRTGFEIPGGLSGKKKARYENLSRSLDKIEKAILDTRGRLESDHPQREIVGEIDSVVEKVHNVSRELARAYSVRENWLELYERMRDLSQDDKELNEYYELIVEADLEADFNSRLLELSKDKNTNEDDLGNAISKVMNSIKV